MNLITKGFGNNSKLITLGFGINLIKKLVKKVIQLTSSIKKYIEL